MKIHRVTDDETVYDIAAKYGVNPIRLTLDNEIELPRRLAIGRELLVLTPTRTYTVKQGDTLDKIADRFCVHKDSLRMQNPELYESAKLYRGQVINVKSSAVTLGMGIANGYLYPGYKRDRLVRCIPYLSYITVCSAIVKEGKITTIFDDSEVLELSAASGKIPLLRIYTADETDIYTEELSESIVLLAKSRGYEGIALTEKALATQDKEKMLEFKKRLIERDLLLIVERDINSEGCSPIADMSVLGYDKIELQDIPSFKDGEEKAMIEYAERCYPESAFLDISPFALVGGKYKEKREALAYLDRHRGTLEYDVDKKILVGVIDKGKRSAEVILESLENTKAKLELVAELGYLGISFDIMRAHISDMLLFAGMFDRPPTVKRRTVCNPRD